MQAYSRKSGKRTEKKFKKCVKLTETRRDRDARRERTKGQRERERGGRE